MMKILGIFFILIQSSNGFASIAPSKTVKKCNVKYPNQQHKKISNQLIINRGGAIHAKIDSDDEDSPEPVEVDLVTSSFADETAQNAKQMSNSAMNDENKLQQSKSYFLSAALWSSLALDSILNKKKRCLLIPGVQELGGRIAVGNIAETAHLASGFLLAAGAAFFLSREFGREEQETWEYEMQNEKARKNLHLLLFGFGVINLFGNANPAVAPYFGLGGFVINCHNALISLNGWIKESSSAAISGMENDAKIKDLTSTMKSMIKSLFRTADLSLGFKNRMMSSLFMSSALIAGLRVFGIITKSLIPHYSACYAAKTFSIGSAGQLQSIGLEWAGLSRAILAGGICITIKEEIDNGRFKGRIAKSLSLIVAAAAFMSGIPTLFSSNIEQFSSGFKLVLFGIIAAIGNLM